MNRRIILVDSEEFPGFFKIYNDSIPESAELYTLQELEDVDEGRRRELLNLGETDAALLIGSGPFTYLQQFYHFGIRSENYYDCSIIRRVSIEGGAFVKCTADLPESKDYEDFFSEDFAKHRDFSWFKQKVIHDYQGAMSLLNYMDSLPEDTDYGYDYEGSGMPLDKWYELSGVSICTTEFGGFISFTDLRHNSTKEQYNDVLSHLAQFVMKRMTHIWTYNLQYEYQVSHRMLGIDAYELSDASVVNVLDGFHLKKFSLKWTGNRVLETTVWDADFDRISEIIDSMLFEVTGKLKKDKHKIIKPGLTPDNFKETPEWAELCKIYPGYSDEFESLIKEYWGNAFMCIPSDILGYYCNLDAFYTLMIYKVKQNDYTKECFDIFLDNIRLGARLMSGGLYINEPFRAKYEKYTHEQMAWAITYCATARCWTKMEKRKKKAASPRNYKPEALKLIEHGRFYGGDAVEIVKDILKNNIDTLDTTDTGLDEGGLLMFFGQDFAEQLVNIVRDAMTEVKMKTKIDETIVRKKKILGIIAEKITPLLGLDKLPDEKRHRELEKYMYYKRAYTELCKIKSRQLTDINNVPEKIVAFGKEYELLEYSDYISNEYFKCKSPIENDEIALDFTNLYKAQTSFLAALLESTNQLPETTNFYSGRGITDINVAFNEFMDEWKNYFDTGILNLYPQKIFDRAMVYFKDPEEDKAKEIWTDINGFLSQTTFFPDFNLQYEQYEAGFAPEDLNDCFFFMRKLCLNYLVYKKYAKLCSTYVGKDGMFKKNNKYVIDDAQHMPIREADPDEPGAVEKCFIHFNVLELKSKRWSSPIHTTISHSDCKKIIDAPNVLDKNGNVIYGGSDQVLTYFDISSAEVKAAGYASGDPDLISKFNAGEDIYIYSAKIYLGEDGWNELSKGQKKKWRKRFKTIFLGVLYGLGKNSLAERLECDIDEADKIIQSLYTSFPQLRHYVDSQGKYPLEHDGYVNTMLGDKLKVIEWNYLKKATDRREKNNLIARIQRLGVNLPIQGGTSTIMQHGFFNNIRQSIKEGWEMPLQPIITVHDSNTNYVPVDKIFEIRKFYDVNYTDHCATVGPGIRLLFDLLAGCSYDNAKDMKQIDPNTIEFTGDAFSILEIYDKLMACKKISVSCDKTRDEIEGSIQFITDPYYRFILEGGCNMTKDISNITVRFHKN